jgi:hypothetical protein
MLAQEDCCCLSRHCACCASAGGDDSNTACFASPRSLRFITVRKFQRKPNSTRRAKEPSGSRGMSNLGCQNRYGESTVCIRVLQLQLFFSCVRHVCAQTDCRIECQNIGPWIGLLPLPLGQLLTSCYYYCCCCCNPPPHPHGAAGKC